MAGLRSSLTISKLVEDNKWSGWAKRKNNAPSYAENYFITLFEKEGIKFEREVKIGRWFADFVIGSLVVEVDGKQHDRPERAASDAIKDAFLNAQGYAVLRIKWSNPCTVQGKSKLYPQIDILKKMVSDVGFEPTLFFIPNEVPWTRLGESEIMSKK